MAQGIEALRARMRTCRRCLEAGYPITPGAVFSGPASARVMVVGQTPGASEVEARRPFNGPAGRRLFRWLAEVGWEEADFRATQYLTAVTRCYPGKAAGGRGDRVPTRAEQRLCAPFLQQELKLIRPALVIPVGGLAVRRFLEAVRLEEVVGTAFWHEDGYWIVPLPHPSGASLWLNWEENRARIARALDCLRKIREELRL